MGHYAATKHALHGLFQSAAAGLPALRANLLGQLLGRLSTHVDHDQLHAVLGTQQCQLPTEPIAGTGDDRDLVTLLWVALLTLAAINLAASLASSFSELIGRRPAFAKVQPARCCQ